MFVFVNTINCPSHRSATPKSCRPPKRTIFSFSSFHFISLLFLSECWWSLREPSSMPVHSNDNNNKYGYHCELRNVRGSMSKCLMYLATCAAAASPIFILLLFFWGLLPSTCSRALWSPFHSSHIEHRNILSFIVWHCRWWICDLMWYHHSCVASCPICKPIMNAVHAWIIFHQFIELGQSRILMTEESFVDGRPIHRRKVYTKYQLIIILIEI